MRTHVLKLGFLSLLLLTFFGCADCSECEKEKESLKNQLDSINQSTTTEVQNENESLFLYLKKYDVKGRYSTTTGTIDVSIPITDRNLGIAEPPVDISSSSCNAILIRVDNNTEGCTPQLLSNQFINKTILIRDVKLDTTRLKEHKKLIVIIVKCNDQEFAGFIAKYKRGIDALNGNYTNFKTILTNGCFNGIIRPNEDGGDIIVGG